TRPSFPGQDFPLSRQSVYPFHSYNNKHRLDPCRGLHELEIRKMYCLAQLLLTCYQEYARSAYQKSLSSVCQKNVVQDMDHQIPRTPWFPIVLNTLLRSSPPVDADTKFESPFRLQDQFPLEQACLCYDSKVQISGSGYPRKTLAVEQSPDICC